MDPPSQSKRFDEEIVKVWLSRTPGEEKVIAIQRGIILHKEPHPAIAPLKSSAMAKYALPRSTFEHRDNLSDITGWLFDAQKQILTSGKAKSGPLEHEGRMPKSVHPRDGIGFNLVLYANN